MSENEPNRKVSCEELRASGSAEAAVAGIQTTGRIGPASEGPAQGWGLKTCGDTWAPALRIWPWTQVLITLPTNKETLMKCLYFSAPCFPL